MKRLIYSCFIVCVLAILSSCSGGSNDNTNWPGIYVNKYGTAFQLNADSTAVITFDEDTTYESTWSEVQTEDTGNYVLIEFAGDKDYYFLKNKKIYRSKNEMMNDRNGVSVSKSSLK